MRRPPRSTPGLARRIDLFYGQADELHLHLTSAFSAPHSELLWYSPLLHLCLYVIKDRRLVSTEERELQIKVGICFTLFSESGPAWARRAYPSEVKQFKKMAELVVISQRLR